MIPRWMANIDASHEKMDKETFKQWLLEYLCMDINNCERDSTRLEMLRYVALNGLLY